MLTKDSTFVFPYGPLSSDRVSLIPWDINTHSELYVNATKDLPELSLHLPWVPFQTLDEFLQWYNARVAPDPTQMLYAVYSKGSDGQQDEFAGMIGCLNASADHAVLEIGCVVTIPKFQRTHVTTHATALLLQYCLDAPPNGLGLRRVQWQANSPNVRSIKAAQRLGFNLEGIIRWQRVLPDGCQGNGVDVSHLPEIAGKKLGAGRDTAILAICWDEWPEKREQLLKMMARV